MVTEQEVIGDISARMQKTIGSLGKELSTVRTGRAAPDLVENITINYYGTETPLNQLASISVPEARTLMIQPWDKQSVGDIEKSILKSDLGLVPNNDGEAIRITIPTLTEDRRREFVRLVNRKVEEFRVSVRNIRRDGLELLRTNEKEKKLSKDEARRGQQKLQEVTDLFIQQITEKGAQKEAEVMEV